MEAEGVVSDQGVIVRDTASANRLHQRGRFGHPLSGGSLQLSFLESLYLVEMNRLEVVDEAGSAICSKDIMSMGLEHDRRFDTLYLVYRALRSTGLVTLEASPLDLRVHTRSGYSPKTPARYFVEAVAERDRFELVKVMDNVSRIEGIKRDYVMALVDEEGDLTYYQVVSMRPEARQTPAGLVCPRQLRHGGAIGNDRVIVSDPACATALHSSGYFGKPLGTGLLLSLVEAAYLEREGVLEISSADGKVMAGDEFMLMAERIQPDLGLRLAVYTDLRKKGITVKTGFKYGAHFRIYLEDPQNTHSDYLIHAVDWDYSTGWAEMSRGVRLAHAVRKDLVLAAVREGRVIEYVAIKRKKI